MEDAKLLLLFGPGGPIVKYFRVSHLLDAPVAEEAKLCQKSLNGTQFERDLTAKNK
jgi:hypothetical protein